MKSAIAALAAVSICAAAVAKEPVLQPYQIGAETVRYQQGMPTVDLETPEGAVQMTPMGFDHGNVVFSVAVINGKPAPSNFDTTNFSAKVGDLALSVFTAQQLTAKAENRAMWTSIALAAVGAMAVAASANDRTHYSSVTHTPFGTYRSWGSYRSGVDQLQTAALAAGTVGGIASVQRQLDETRAAIGNNVVQMTTVDPGDSYAGKIVIQKIKGPLPQKIQITVDWNGVKFPFAWQIAKQGTPAPRFDALTPPMPREQGPLVVPASGTSMGGSHS